MLEGSMQNQAPSLPQGMGMRDLQKQVPDRVDPMGNKMPGPRLAQKQRPQAQGMGGPVSKAGKSYAKAAAIGLIAGSVGLGGITAYSFFF